MNRNDTPEKLPRESLPDSPIAPPENRVYWEARIQQLMTAAEPALARYRRHGAEPMAWWHALAQSWRPAMAGGLALAAGVLLALVVGAGERTAPPPGDPALAAVVSDGEPAALWAAVDREADPVLALIALDAEPEAEGEIR